MERKRYGWTARGIVGMIFLPIGLVFLPLGILLWYHGAGNSPQDPAIVLGVFGGMGAAFLLTGLALLGSDLRRRALQRRAYEGGNCVMAKITGVQAIRSVNINGRNPVTVECRYTDPATDTAHIWYSRYLYADVRDMLKSDEVPVYIDRTDGRIGFVDIDAVLPEIRIHR